MNLVKLPLVALLAFSSLTAILSPSVALAGTSTGQFKVTITVQADCKLTSTTDLAFGNTGIIQSAITSNAAIGVQCTNTTPYNLGLNVGAGTGATVAIRKMTSGAAATIDYSLYRDAAFTQPWGDTVASNTLGGTGNGAVQTLTVYGRVPIQNTPAPGAYSDTVQVVVTF
jgi:spore coat protein U-like protein